MEQVRGQRREQARRRHPTPGHGTKFLKVELRFHFAGVSGFADAPGRAGRAGRASPAGRTCRCRRRRGTRGWSARLARTSGACDRRPPPAPATRRRPHAYHDPRHRARRCRWELLAQQPPGGDATLSTFQRCVSVPVDVQDGARHAHPRRRAHLDLPTVASPPLAAATSPMPAPPSLHDHERTGREEHVVPLDRARNLERIAQ